MFISALSEYHMGVVITRKLLFICSFINIGNIFRSVTPQAFCRSVVVHIAKNTVCGNEIFRFCGIFFSKEFFHIYKSVIADMFTDPEAEIFSGKYDQSCSVRQMLMIGTHGVLHGMLESASCDIHGITGHGILVTPFFLADSR